MVCGDDEEEVDGDGEEKNGDDDDPCQIYGGEK